LGTRVGGADGFGLCVTSILSTTVPIQPLTPIAADTEASSYVIHD